MHATQALVRISLLSLAVGFILLAVGLVDARLDSTGFFWFRAHGLVLTLGAVLPGLAALHAWSLHRLAGTTLPADAVEKVAVLWLAGTMLAAVGAAIGPSRLLFLAGFLGLVLITGAGTWWAVIVMKGAPKRGLTDVARDPLTKGDDACLKHIHFAHRFLPLGLLLLLPAALLMEMGTSPWGPRLHVAGTHILVVGYGLLSIYGLSHLWVPRLSGVPAIAAGAIKGELHSSLLGIVGITAGFLVGAQTPVGRGLLVGLGPFVFLGFFVWMGVLGANIMRNKSPTNTVRPEFVYIPWTFFAVFWLVTAVLMGIFLNVLPDSLASNFDALRFAHLHVGLLGGAVQILLGLGTRLLPMAAGAPPPRFGSAMKGSFYLFNLGLAVALWGRWSGVADAWVAAGLGIVVVSLALYARAMAPFMNRSSSAPA